MSWIPAGDPPPPDDHHTWAMPTPEPCPDCECCTARLCEQAIARATACHLEAPSALMAVALCHCIQRASAIWRRTGGGDTQ